MSNFENLKVWQKAVSLAISIYRLTNESKSFKSDFSLKDQVRRAAVSISRKMQIHFGNVNQPDPIQIKGISY